MPKINKLQRVSYPQRYPSTKYIYMIEIQKHKRGMWGAYNIKIIQCLSAWHAYICNFYYEAT